MGEEEFHHFLSVIANEYANQSTIVYEYANVQTEWAYHYVGVCSC